MTIRDLPREVLDLVFSQIHDKTSAPTCKHSSSFQVLPIEADNLVLYSRITNGLLFPLPYLEIIPPSRSRTPLLSPLSVPGEQSLFGEIPRASLSPSTTTINSLASRRLSRRCHHHFRRPQIRVSRR